MKYELGRHEFFLSQKVVNLGEKLPKSTYRVSYHGVPHLVIDNRYSVCYFSGSKMWRIFYPYPSNGQIQRRVDLFAEEDVINYFNDRRRVKVG